MILMIIYMSSNVIATGPRQNSVVIDKKIDFGAVCIQYSFTFLTFCIFLCIFWCAKQQNSSDSKVLTQFKKLLKIKSDFMLQNAIFWTLLSTVLLYSTTKLLDFHTSDMDPIIVSRTKKIMRSLKRPTKRD